MRYGSVCSGIEAATVAWHPLGWKASFLSEIDPNPCAVLKYRWPDIPLHGDFTTIEKDMYDAIDLLVGGTPCQDFSIAGLRKGISGDRGNLTLQYLHLAQRTLPKWILWENVPGVLSSDGGRAFGAFLGGLAKLGYGFAYRVLDAQYFGVAQRRRRVFVVAYLGDWRPAAAVLFERHSLRWDTPPSRKAGEDFAGTLARHSFSGGAGGRPEGAAAGHFIGSHWDGGPHPSLSQSHNTGGIGQSNQEIFSQRGAGLVQQEVFSDVANCLETTCHDYSRADGFNMVVHGTQDPDVLRDLAHTLGRNSGQENAVFPMDLRNAGRDPEKFDEINRQGTGAGNAGDPAHTLTSAFVPGVAIAQRAYGVGEDSELAHCLGAGASKADKHESSTYIVGAGVRRLTPLECERLQGFPDNYTRIPVKTYKTKPRSLHFAKYSDLYDQAPDGTWIRHCADGPRYMELGNSMAVPVMRWLGERIQMIDNILKGEF